MYDTQLYKRFEATSTTKYLVSATYASFSMKEDLERAETFFRGRDVSKYNLALAQAYDSIKAKIRWIEVGFQSPVVGRCHCLYSPLQRSTDDLQSYLEEWEKQAGAKL